MAYGEFKELAGRAASYNMLSDNPVNIAYNPHYDGSIRWINKDFLRWFKKFLIKNRNKLVLIGVLPHLLALLQFS